jgi:hypothetical protein
LQACLRLQNPVYHHDWQQKKSPISGKKASNIDGQYLKAIALHVRMYEPKFQVPIATCYSA